jgi:glycosyltransferase involved in cell wall biosynthesis
MVPRDGRRIYADAAQILIAADSEGSNDYRLPNNQSHGTEGHLPARSVQVLQRVQGERRGDDASQAATQQLSLRMELRYSPNLMIVTLINSPALTMHIAFWSPAWPLEKYPNGIITYVHWMKHALESRGHRVSVFTSTITDPFGENSGNERIHVVRLRPMDRVRRKVANVLRPPEYEVFHFSHPIAAEILRVHRRDRIDVLEMEESFGWFADIEKLISLPVLVKLHGPAFLSLVEEELRTPFGKEKIEREGQALRRASTITAPSKHTLSQTVAFYGLKPDRQEHIVNPITLNQGVPLWRLDSCDRRLILYVGRFDLRKGADVVLKGFRSVLRSRPDLKLIFVGPDRGLPTDDGRCVNFREYLHELYPPDLRDHVDFRGSLPNREVGVLRTKAMMTVVASRWENQGYAVLEAMLQGCPVVCTDAGGCPENVIDGVTGFLAKSGDADAFAAKISMMLDNPAGAAAMGEAARHYALENHSVNKVAEKSMALYEQVVRAS